MKGKGWEGASVLLEEGLKMHGSIDSFTDSHELVLKSKSRLGNKGYLKGVVIDMAYDYLLLKNWNQYSNISLECFINTFYSEAGMAVETYPDYAKNFVTGLIRSKNLTSYDTFEGLEATFLRIDNRLSERILAKDSTVKYLPVLKRQVSGIEEDFLEFFPDLIGHFKSKAGSAFKDHWLK